MNFAELLSELDNAQYFKSLAAIATPDELQLAASGYKHWKTKRGADLAVFARHLLGLRPRRKYLRGHHDILVG